MAFRLPTRSEWKTLFDNLSKKEKAYFAAFFLVAWVSGIFLLREIDHRFASRVPASGGSITEGIVGTPRFINPLLVINDADRDLEQIIYAGLMKPDGHGSLAPQLAERYEVSEDGLTYTFYLRKNLQWHDGAPLTADDVVFTINLAKNPAIRSSKFANWEGVTATATSDRVIEFRLKRPFAPFIEQTTLGILPKHLWEKVTAEEFSSSNFNTKPIGSGPFQITSVSKNAAGIITSLSLSAFKRYQPHAPYIKTMNIRFYRSDKDLDDALKRGEVDTASTDDGQTKPRGNRLLNIELPRIVAVFFNPDNFQPFRDQALRDALNTAVDRGQIVREAVNNRARVTSLSIPPGTFGYDESLEQISYDIDRARDILSKAGYEDTDGDGIIEKKVSKKEKIPIEFTIVTANAPELVKTAEIVKGMWEKLGIRVKIEPLEQGDLKEEFIRPRNYQALLFGQILGEDPDPYAFWHTSQRKHPGVNLAEYANTKVDKILEDARATVDQQKRADLYRDFEAEIAKDKPAVFLYSPTLLYSIPKYLNGTELSYIPYPQARFANIDSWYITTKRVWNVLLRR